MADATLRRALLVDAMGTLIHLQAPAPRLRAALRARHGVEVSLAAAGSALRAEIAYYRAHMLEGRDQASVADLQARCALVLRDALPAGSGAGRIAPAAMTDVLLGALRFAAYPDAAPALRSARERGQRIVVVSNWDASLGRALAAAGLGALIDAVVTSAAFGAAKPDPAIFAHALRLAGAPADAALHAGDSLDEDVAGARAAGLPAVWCNRNRAPVPDGVRAIASLAELPA